LISFTHTHNTRLVHIPYQITILESFRRASCPFGIRAGAAVLAHEAAGVDNAAENTMAMFATTIQHSSRRLDANRLRPPASVRFQVSDTTAFRFETLA
jgi:hypothetical protein